MERWKKLTEAAYSTTRWSGGTTTQLAIAPEGADYGRRDFLWRVSSAAVELEESEFTALPDYLRLIAPLEGEISLSHNGGGPIPLRPYQVHAFDGADETRSHGRCRDFNLMLRRGVVRGRMEALCPGPSGLELPPAGGTLLLFCADRACRIVGAPGEILLERGESLLAEDPGTLRLLPAGEQSPMLMLCSMQPAAEE